MLDTVPVPTTRAADPAAGATTAQARRALELANTRRTAVCQLKRRLGRRELTVAEVVLDPPEHAHKYLLFEVLQWAPRYGRSQLRALNVRAVRRGELNLASELGALTPRQRQWLATQLGGRR